MQKDFSLLFITGVARGGTNLVSRVLDVHDKIAVALDPFFPLFKSLRNAIVRSSGNKSWAEFCPEIPLQDYYFTDERLRILDTVQAGSLTVAFDESECSSLQARLTERAKIECPDIVPHLGSISGKNYLEMLINSLHIIAGSRGSDTTSCVGIKEVWIVEFYALLAKAFPDARFIVIMRDPRAAVSSMLGFKEKDPSQVTHTLSFARHWRKYAAFIHYFQNSFFAQRFHVVSYEKLLDSPEHTVRGLCAFLDVPFDDRMLDAKNFHDIATGSVWKGNSTFEESMTAISKKAADRWRTKLDTRVAAMIDFVCGPEMELLGYKPAADQNQDPETSRILEYIMDNDTEPCSWRSDLGDPQKDFGFELFRRVLLDLPQVPTDNSLIRRSFLFESLYIQLRRNNQSEMMQTYASS